MNEFEKKIESQIFKKETNVYYDTAKPLITIRTSTFNRGDLLPRLFESLEAQSFRDFEYILVDNGSTENIDDVVEEFMMTTKIPMLYIKKCPGGIQEGYNCGVYFARGRFIVGIDSDDFLMPDALEVYMREWGKIPSKEKKIYRGIIACCKDQNNNRIGPKFPDNINEMAWKRAYQIYIQTNSEHLSMDRTDICKRFLLPEPEGMHYVETYIMWGKMDKIYKSYFSNEIVRVYYLDTKDSLIHSDLKKKSVRTLYECQWNWLYYLNHWNEFPFRKRSFFRYHLLFAIYGGALAKIGKKHFTRADLTGKFNRITSILCAPFARLCTVYYIRKHRIAG